MTWDRASLAKQGFYYDENIRSKNATEAAYPPHAEALRASMLDFSCPVLGCKHEIDESGNLQLDAESIDWHSPRLDPGLSAAKRTQHEARHLNNGGFAEIVWNAFFHNHFFKPLQDSTSMCKANSRRYAYCMSGGVRNFSVIDKHQRVSRSNYYYDSFKEDADALWTEFFRSKTHVHDASEKEKCPKPDRVLSLPIYNLDTESPAIPSIRDPESRQWHQSPNPSLVESFSWTVLKELFASGLRPTPFRIFHDPPVEAELRCYPWLIIEHKKQPPKSPDSKTLDVRCQATNAAARALQLNRNAATYAIKLAEQAQVPPIPTVTTVGPIVTVWIMHYLEDLCGPSSHYDLHEEDRETRREGYIMRAIWKGDMMKLDDIIQFQLILENTHTWAMRVFKPLMASYIGQWRFVHSQPGISMAELALERRRQVMDRCRVMIPLIQGYLDTHSGAELRDDSTRSEVTPLLLGLLVQQIFASERQILANEMDRIITERLQVLPLGARQIVSDARLTIPSQHTSLVANTQEPRSLGSAPYDDDPNDSDYLDSQPASHPIINSNYDDNEFRRSTRSNALREAEAQSPPSSPQLLPIEDTPRPLGNMNSPGAVTPLSASTAPTDSSTPTPTRNKSTSPKSASSVTQNVTGTTKRVQSLEEGSISIKSTTRGDKSNTGEKAFRLWHKNAKISTQVLKYHADIADGVAVSLDSKLVATAPNKTVQLWRTDTGECTQIIEGHNRRVISMSFSHDSEFVAFAPSDHTIRLWRAETGKFTHTKTLEGHTDYIESMAFSYDSKFLASASNDHTVRIWLASSGKCLHVLKGHIFRVNSVAISHDSTVVASGSSDETVRLWRTEKGDCMQIFNHHTDRVHSVAFSHDSKFIASASADKTVRLWLAGSGKCLHVLTGHISSVTSVAISHDSTVVASGSHDTTIRLWHTDTGECTQILNSHDGAIMSVAFAKDSKFVTSTSYYGTARLWRADMSDDDGDSVSSTSLDDRESRNETKC